MRTPAALMAACALTACASGEVVETSGPTRHVDQRMLLPNAAALATGAATMYEMKAQERFRVPQPLEDSTPRLPEDSPRTTLVPTTVCARIVVTEQGEVLRADPLDDRDECHAGNAPENADLMQAVRGQLLQWKFVPAAICTWPAVAHPPGETEDCAGAESVEPVAVTLMYAFTFEIREGKATVRQRRANER